MTQLSIFVDESGDFGVSSDYYVVALVLHHQSHDLSGVLSKLDSELQGTEGLSIRRAIHTGPVIRGENEYRGLSIETRRREFSKLFAFARLAPVSHQVFTFRKREHPGRSNLKRAIAKALAGFLFDSAAYFLSFDQAIVYYDNGQAEITDVLDKVCHAFFFNVDFRRVQPTEYRLFQVADLHCTLEFLRIKCVENKLSKSDIHFFESRKNLKKNYLGKLDNKRFAGIR